MKNIIRALTLISYLLCVLHFHPAEAQIYYNAPPYEFDLIGKGGRAAGMGYAFSGIADDATAIYWNPAGIAQMNRAELSIVNRLTFTNVFYSFWPSRRYKPIYDLDYFGLVVPFKLGEKTFSLGVSYQNKINYKEQFTSYSRQGIPEEELSNNITINSVSGCIAHALLPFLYLGVTFDTWFSIGGRQDYKVFIRDWYIDEALDTFDLNYTRITDTKYRGLSLAIGILMDFSYFGFPYRVSLKYDSPKFIRNQNRDEETFRYPVYGENDLYYTQRYEGGRLYFINNIITLGMSYRLGDYFTLALDLDYKPFSKSGFVFTGNWYCDFDPSAIIDSTYTEAFAITEAASNMHQVRVGGEYLLKTNIGFIPLRAGWKLSPTSLVNYSIYKQPIKQVRANSFTAGLGLIKNRYSLDLAYEYYGYQRNDSEGFLELGRYHFLVVSAIYNF